MIYFALFSAASQYFRYRGNTRYSLRSHRGNPSPSSRGCEFGSLSRRIAWSDPKEVSAHAAHCFAALGNLWLPYAAS
jgi:hypothetical protein